EPQVTDTDVVDEVAALRIDRGNPRLAVQHVGPLSRLVPVQLAYAAGVQANVHAGNSRGNAELTHGHLARPAASLEARVSVGEREPKVRQRPVIRAGRHEDIGILASARRVARAWVRAANARPLRLLRRCCRGGGN